MLELLIIQPGCKFGKKVENFGNSQPVFVWLKKIWLGNSILQPVVSAWL